MNIRHFLTLAVLAFACASADAATTGNSFVTPQTPKGPLAQILNATSTNPVTLATAGLNGSAITSILCSSTDGTARIVILNRVRSATSYQYTAVAIPINAGNDSATPTYAVSLLPTIPGLPVDSSGNRYLILESGDTLTVNVAVAVTAAKAISCHAVQNDY